MKNWSLYTPLPRRRAEGTCFKTPFFRRPSPALILPINLYQKSYGGPFFLRTPSAFSCELRTKCKFTPNKLLVKIGKNKLLPERATASSSRPETGFNRFIDPNNRGGYPIRLRFWGFYRPLREGRIFAYGLPMKRHFLGKKMPFWPK